MGFLLHLFFFIFVGKLAMRSCLFVLFLLCVLSVHAQNVKADSLYRKCLHLKVHSGINKQATIQDYLKSDSLAVFLFFTTDCPVCLSYVDFIQQFSSNIENKQIPFFLVFCGNSRFGELKRFKKRYGISCLWLEDKHFDLAKYLQASTFPEIFIFDSRHRTVKYHGKIDNRFERVGQRRNIVTESYFQDALLAVLNGNSLVTTYTPPVGCFIEIPE